MRNVKTEMLNGKLVITIDASEPQRLNAPLSKSGKNRLLATTAGTVSVGDLKLGLNVFF